MIRKILVSILLFSLSFPFFPTIGYALSLSSVTEKIEKLVQHGAVLLDNGEREIISLHVDEPFIPASILKIVTASCAFSILGPTYHFKTHFFQGPDNTLYMKGYGDPMLVSEELERLASQLQTVVTQPVPRIYVDGHYFEVDQTMFGTKRSKNPYDATNAALAVNFNTVHISRNAAGTLQSAEPQTPLLPFMRKYAHVGKPAESLRINIQGNQELSSRYAAELLASKLRGNGVDVAHVETQKNWTATVPENAEKRLTYSSSQDLKAIVAAMLLYSNNFIANQLFLTLGTHSDQPPGTFEKGSTILKKYLETSLGKEAEGFVIEEGSGLSRNNRVTARGMRSVLRKCKQYADLFPRKGAAFVKSGTLHGVYAYAGYLKRDEELWPFVILLNQKENTRDTILHLLAKIE